MKRVHSDSTDSSEHDTEYSQDESVNSESDIFDDEEIEDLAEQLSNSIPRDKALDFIHSLATSKDILNWNSHGEMMYHQRRIPVTSMADLIEYAMLPYNLEVKTPRGLKTFTVGLSEVGIDKRLIRNKKLLADLVARQPEEEDTDDSEFSGDEDEDETDKSQTESESEPTESDSGGSESSESDDEPRECHVCRDFKPFYKIPVVQCPQCLWREGYYAHQNQYVECDICTHVFPVDVNTMRAKFYRCQDCDAVHQLSFKFKKLKLVDPEEHESEEESS